jgi:ribosome biogenesis GTP-binding protein ysxC
MKIKNATFITSVADSGKFYKTNKPIIAVAGKSNVGKSSVINMLAGNGKLARTSVTPGRTRLINYFDFGEFVLADLPGYGFAKVSKSEKDKWGKLMDDFLKTEDLALLITLLDIRHDPTAEDFMMLNFLYHYAIPFVPVATKSDKLSKTRVKPAAAKIASAIKVGASDVIACSSVTGAGKDAILSAIEKAISVQRERGADEDSEADGEEK